MTMQPLEELVSSAVAAACRADPATIGPGTELREIGLDSLSLVSVAALIESACGVELDADATARLFDARSVAHLIEVFERARAASGA